MKIRVYYYSLKVLEKIQIFIKMRNKFADEYNLVTIQCDYFGWEFMQGYDEIKAPKIDKDIFNIFTKK